LAASSWDALALLARYRRRRNTADATAAARTTARTTHATAIATVLFDFFLALLPEEPLASSPLLPWHVDRIVVSAADEPQQNVVLHVHVQPISGFVGDTEEDGDSTGAASGDDDDDGERSGVRVGDAVGPGESAAALVDAPGAGAAGQITAASQRKHRAHNTSQWQTRQEQAGVGWGHVTSSTGTLCDAHSPALGDGATDGDASTHPAKVRIVGATLATISSTLAVEGYLEQPPRAAAGIAFT
jgi:hypothetical protein